VSDQQVTEVLVVERADGSMLAYMFEGGAAWFERHVPQINALNVFPVPDGDTGTNMFATIQNAMRELRSKQAAGESAADVASRMARGALMGARGNSGVILSQILRGMSDAIANKHSITAEDFANSMQRATDKAYSAIQKPVEGTILTVVREAAEAALNHIKTHKETNLVTLMEVVVKAAKASELRTPELLPVLKEAGVTDSGGHGLWVFFDGLLRHLKGEKIDATLDWDSPEMQAMLNSFGHPKAGESLTGVEWGYDIQYLITARPGKPLAVNEIREYISSIGDCALVVGDESLIKVHVHCPNPGPAITYGAEHGSLSDVVVEDMDMQAEAFLDHEHEPEKPKIAAVSTDAVTGIGIVAVSPGDGFDEVFQSLGVGQLIGGGQSMNPSTEDILKAVEGCAADTVIVLPNNKNIILSANQVHDLTHKKVHVLPTRTVPQGIAAVMAFNYTASAEDNLEAMQEAVAHVQTGEVTTGIRTTSVDGVAVTEGDIIGILNGKLVVSTKTPLDTVRGLLGKVDLSKYEIATFYYGDNITESEAQAVLETLKEEFSGVEMDLYRGGQPMYHFIFSVE
jgi:DAK2 domain fusion protein YloV